MVTFSEAIQTLTDKNKSNIGIGQYIGRQLKIQDDHMSSDSNPSIIPPTVLVIDDDASVCHMLTVLLEDQKYYVFSASNGHAAVEILKELDVDLVVTDIIMPGMEGIELIRNIKKTSPKIKIIAMSGYRASGQLDYLRYAREFGVDHTFQKPFDVLQFLQTVKELIPQGA